MEISNVQSKHNFRGLDYSKASKYIVKNFIDIPDCPRVLEDLKKLATKADIYIQDRCIPVSESISIPGIEFIITPFKPGFFKRLFLKKQPQNPITTTLDVSYGGLPFNILPIAIKDTMRKIGIIKIFE